MTRPQPSTATVESPTTLHDALALDDLFEVLASRPRRRAILALDARRDAADADEFVTSLVASDGVTDSDTEIAFYHNHLPRLADHGIVEYDREAGIVRPGENLATAASSLTAISEEQSTARVEN